MSIFPICNDVFVAMCEDKGTDVKYPMRIKGRKLNRKKSLLTSIIFPVWFLISLKKDMNMDKSLDLSFIK